MPLPVALLFCLHSSCTQTSKNAGFSSPPSSLKSWRALGGAGESGCKQSPDFLHCCEVGRACLECHNPAPAVEPLNGVGTGGLIPHPFLFPLCRGRKGDSAEEKGGSTPKPWSCFLSERNKTFCRARLQRRALSLEIFILEIHVQLH